MIKTIFFDLDGTLLPMDQDIFLRDYFDRLAEKMVPYGYDAQTLKNNIWISTGAMVKNNGTVINEEAFWNAFSKLCGKDARCDEAIFQDFYHNEFQEVQHSCGFDPSAANTIQKLKEQGYQLILATNPLFPAVATQSRIRWAGLNPDDFVWVTTYENSSYCKPNVAYYQEILDRWSLNPEECIMVGNDAEEDMAAASAGMNVFLLTDCLINKYNIDIADFPQGSFPELSIYIQNLR
jgi:HAD superfamily hydrolase (TIGR01549 family)